MLFLDELTEYPINLLESLRQPLEDKNVRIVRAMAEYLFPADFMLVAAMNPCKCGYYPDRTRCFCTDHDIQRFMGRISQPIWDRFDMTVKVGRVDFSMLSQDADEDIDTHTDEESYDDYATEELNDNLESFDNEKLYDEYQRSEQARKVELNACVESEKCKSDNLRKKNPYTSANMRVYIERARERQRERFKGDRIFFNSQMSSRQVGRYCRLGWEEKDIMEKAFTQLNLTARGYEKILKTARTIADMEGEEDIAVVHLAEAISYRNNGIR